MTVLHFAVNPLDDAVRLFSFVDFGLIRKLVLIVPLYLLPLNLTVTL